MYVYAPPEEIYVSAICLSFYSSALMTKQYHLAVLTVEDAHKQVSVKEMFMEIRSKY